jgi:hypothetical protein
MEVLLLDGRAKPVDAMFALCIRPCRVHSLSVTTIDMRLFCLLFGWSQRSMKASPLDELRVDIAAQSIVRMTSEKPHSQKGKAHIEVPTSAHRLFAPAAVH